MLSSPLQTLTLRIRRSFGAGACFTCVVIAGVMAAVLRKLVFVFDLYTSTALQLSGRIASSREYAVMGIQLLRICAAAFVTFFRANNAAWSAFATYAANPRGVFVKLIHVFNFVAARANAVSVGVATGFIDALAHMKQSVVSRVLANDKIRVPVVFLVAVNVMNFRAFRQRFTQRLFGNHHMHALGVFVTSSDIFTMPGSRSVALNEVVGLSLHDASPFHIARGESNRSAAAAFTRRIGISHVERPSLPRVVVRGADGVNGTAALCAF